MRFTRLAIACVVAVVAVAPGAADAASSLLFTLTTGKGAVVAGGGPARISVPANAAVTWFTDRPERQVGHMTARDLAASWATYGFRGDPPNAAVVVREDRHDVSRIVMLMAPIMRGGRIAFRVVEVPGAQVMRHTHDAALRSAGPVHLELFIDDVSTDCAGFAGDWTATDQAGQVSPFLSVSPACEFVRHTDDGNLDWTPYASVLAPGHVRFRQRAGLWWVSNDLEMMSPGHARLVNQNLMSTDIDRAGP